MNLSLKHCTLNQLPFSLCSLTRFHDLSSFSAKLAQITELAKVRNDENILSKSVFYKAWFSVANDANTSATTTVHTNTEKQKPKHQNTLILLLAFQIVCTDSCACVNVCADACLRGENQDQP